MFISIEISKPHPDSYDSKSTKKRKINEKIVINQIQKPVENDDKIKEARLSTKKKSTTKKTDIKIPNLSSATM